MHEKIENNHAATDKQKQLIQNIIEKYPKTEKNFEYRDYTDNPTISNASAFIMAAAESEAANRILQTGDALNLVSYVANRPGVVKAGVHGLFGSEDEVDLEAVQKEISEHEGKIWTHIVSLRREDADALGYDTQQP